MFSSRCVKKLTMVMGLAMLGTSWGVLAQSAAHGVATSADTVMHALHPAVTLHKGDRMLGPLAVSQPMHVVVTLKLRNEQQLDDYIAKPGFRPLTSAQFRMLYGPSKVQAQAVADYLVKAGFGNVKIAPNNAFIEADGRADTAQAAFKTSFMHVKTHDGRDAFANNSAIQIPSNLQDVVQAVLGVQNVHIAHAMARRYDPTAVHTMTVQAQTSGGQIGHPPSDFPVIYGVGNMPNVTTVAVGSVSAGAMTNVLSDLKVVDPGVTVTLLGNTGIGNSTGGNSDDDEWDLDSQSIIAFTNVKQYYFYVAASLNESDLEIAFAQVVSDNMLRAIDVSLGECESQAQSDGTAVSMDATFKQAVAQGQTFFVADGDRGADECNNATEEPSWPSSSQYVTAVGGTSLYTTSNTAWQSEEVWNKTVEGYGGTGGSPSLFEPIPAWQQGVAGITDQVHRGVPDIAFEGDPASGALITIDGSPDQQYGGTSLSAPLAVGMWAHVLQADGNSLGFAPPVIYKLAQASAFSYNDAFHDVLYGSDSNVGPGGCCSAGPGWDYASGWGSVIVQQFADLTPSYGASSPFVSFATLPALQVTTPIPGSMHAPGDFNGDGTSDLLWFNPSSSQVGYWTMTASAPVGTGGGVVNLTGLATYSVTPNYFVGAVGDFNNDGYADLVFTSANRDLWLWTNNQHGGFTSTRIGASDYPSQWQLIGAGDVDGDGHDDLLWLDPVDCKFGYWTMNGATVTGYHTVNIACGYYPISIGYYTPSNRLSIVWTSAANDLYIWDSVGNTTGGSTGQGFNAYNLSPYFPNMGTITSLGGGYQGTNIGIQTYQAAPVGSGESPQGWGTLFSRSFDANGNQTGIQLLPVYGPVAVAEFGSAGYIIAGQGVNNTGVYSINIDNMMIGTGGLYGGASNALFSGNAPEIPGPFGINPSSWGNDNGWSYPTGWWVVGALFNGTQAPPWY
ncbi:protease pro-enzyme activation domain-containing protein [Dyella dinghuensis]|nr:protease pro-enzyme activation domain-containing protein [Dyella dinghuensis]